MSVRSGSFQIVGDKKAPSKSPTPSPSSDPRGGSYQLVGDNIKMGRAKITSPSSNPSSGTFQKVGDTVTLNRTPIKGWGSAASLPMSKESISQSKTSAGGGRGKK